MRPVRRKAWLLLAALAALPAGSAVAEGTSSAEASAARAEQGERSVAVAHTSADSAGQYEANSLEVNGEPAHGSTGGSAEAGAESSGAGFDTDSHGGDQSPVRVALLPWSADGIAGESEAAFLLLHVEDNEGGDAVEVAVLRSYSAAAAGAGSAETDAAVLKLGGDALVVKLLHAEANGEGGATYLVGVQDNQIASNEQAGEQCAISVPGVADLSCLVVQQAGPEVLAQVADASLGGGQLAAGLFAVMSSQAQPAVSPFPSPEPPSFGEEPSRGGVLARTGEDGLLRLFAALGLLGAGLTGYLVSREDSVATVS